MDLIENKIITSVIEEMRGYFQNDNEHFSATRDVFTARLQSFIYESKKYLEAAIIGATRCVRYETMC